MESEYPNPWQQRSSREIHRTRWLRLIEDEVITPAGETGTYTYIETPPFVVVVPEDDEGRLLLICQFRYPINQWSWEFPAGSVEPGENPEAAVRRELAEETGLTTAAPTKLGTIYEGNSFGSCQGTVFRATNLSGQLREQVEDEGIIRIAWFTQRQVRLMVANGEVTDGTTLTALALYLVASLG